MRVIVPLIVFTVGCLPLAGCSSPNPYDDEYKMQYEGTANNPTGLFASGYFPASYGEPSIVCDHSSRPIELIREIERDWYPRQWQAAYEPSLYLLAEQGTPPEFVLRFSYIPSFDPSIFIRIHKDGNGLRLIAKEMNGAGGYEPGKIARSKEVRLTSGEAMKLQSLLAKNRLFDEVPDTCEMGFDGSKWIFEVVDLQGYRMVKRWSPRDGEAFNLGRHLLDLSGWTVETY